MARKALSWRYRRFTLDEQPTQWVQVSGLWLWVFGGVFNPALHFTSDFLAVYLRRPRVVQPGSVALDLGTGSGIAAVALLLAGCRSVVATDINSWAITCAQYNAELYGLADRVIVRLGDLFEPVGNEQFDLIVSNPPYFRGVPDSLAEHAYMGGAQLEWFDRFATGLGAHLNEQGRCLIVLSDAADLRAINLHLRAHQWQMRIVARRQALVETLYICQLHRHRSNNSGHVENLTGPPARV